MEKKPKIDLDQILQQQNLED